MKRNANFFAKVSSWISEHCYSPFTRHPWYTPSGLCNRTLACLADKWSNSPNDLFPVVIFLYGMVEIFGIGKSLIVIKKLHGKFKTKRRLNARPKEKASMSDMRNRT